MQPFNKRGLPAIRGAFLHLFRVGTKTMAAGLVLHIVMRHVMGRKGRIQQGGIVVVHDMVVLAA